ncbi:MAG: corrinoid-binding protein [Chloroflexota bacterium]|nr:MAG: corrinoid-binding protein [Chloroflexota bacterium]
MGSRLDNNADPTREQFLEAIGGADRALSHRILRGSVESGVQPEWLLLNVIQPALNELGRRWSEGGATLSQIYVAGKIADDACNFILPLLPTSASGDLTVVIGTISGDFHGLGRKLVAAFLRAAGVRVVDLGLGVEPTRFVESAAQEGAQIIAISALMMHTAAQIAQVRPLLIDRGLNHVGILVGGAPFNYDPDLVRRVGADGTAPNAGLAARATRDLALKRGQVR